MFHQSSDDREILIFQGIQSEIEEAATGAEAKYRQSRGA
jgi:hypothetical protein